MSDEIAAQLDAEWGAHWEAGTQFVLEKSPSSLLRTRFLQALFPDAYFLVILRHPVCNAYATHAWGLGHGGVDYRGPDAIVGFVQHWLVAHSILESDLAHLRHVRIVHLEQLATQPQVHHSSAAPAPATAARTGYPRSCLFQARNRRITPSRAVH